MPRRSFQAGRPPPDLQELVARFGGFSRMPVDECGKFDAVMAARESAAERGWRGDRDVALLAEPAAWLRVNRCRYNFGPDGLNGSFGSKADLHRSRALSRPAPTCRDIFTNPDFVRAHR